MAWVDEPDVADAFATLDLYRVEDDSARPLVLLVHGGSWVGEDKDSFLTTHQPHRLVAEKGLHR